MHGTFFLILGLAGLLTIASFLLPIAHRLNFPYTVLLALAGSVLGGTVLVVGEVEGLWLLGDFLNALDEFDITSELVFFIFLPTLIFESALNISVRHLMADIVPILLLAVIGLLISTFVVGTSMWMATGVGLVACLLLGAIVSATDPVAVVAIFKDLGAPHRLTILVEGESLFNDATAIVLFTILAALLVEGGEASVVGAVGDFVVVFLGGVLAGVLNAWIVCTLIGQLHKMPLIEITLTVCLAYFVFLFAEHYLHVSGVMAVVSAGLFVRSYGRTKVSPATWEALVETWEQLGFWANSLIFFLVGLLVPGVLVTFAWADAAALVVLIVAAFAARAVVLFGVLPWLRSLTGLGQSVSRAYRTVMLWGGLRGAVSLALALVVLESPGVSEELKHFIVVMVTGFVLFTLFVNAPTMQLLMRLLGLHELPATELAIRNRVMALSLSHIRRDLMAAAEAYRFEPAIAEEVAAGYEQRLARVEKEMSGGDQLSREELLRVGLATLVNRERELYLGRFASGLIAARTTRVLLFQVDNLRDGLKTGGVEGYRQAVASSLGFRTTGRLALMLHHRLGLSAPLAAHLADRFQVLRATRMVIGQLIEHNKGRSPALLGEAVSEALDALLQQRLQDTWEALSALRLQFPEYARTVQRRHLGRVALRLEEADYQRMLDENLISQDLFNRLIRDIDRRARAFERQPRLDLKLSGERLVAAMPFFAELDPDRTARVARILRPRLAVPGEIIMRRGEPGDAMYFIASGAVEVSVEPEPVRLGSGEFFGAIALVTGEPRRVSATALGYCELLVLRARDFHALMEQHPKLRETVTRTVEERRASWFRTGDSALDYTPSGRE